MPSADHHQGHPHPQRRRGQVDGLAHDQQRPVPEIPAVGEEAEPDEEPERQELRDQRRAAAAGPGHQEGTHAGDQRPVRRVALGRQRVDQRVDHQAAADQAHDLAGRERRRDLGDDQRQRDTQEELEGPGERQVVGRLGVGRGPGDGQPQAGEEQRQADDEQRRPHVAADQLRQQPRQQDQEGHRDVELLLHRQRPGVEQDAGAGRVAEVADLVVLPEEDVGHEPRGGGRGLGGLLLGAGRREQEQADDQDAEEHRRLGRDQPPRSPGVERRPLDPAGLVELTEEQVGDHEAGNHEEQVEADVGALRTRVRRRGTPSP